MLQYDDNGFYFFLLSSLSFYLIPCKLVMAVGWNTTMMGPEEAARAPVSSGHRELSR